MQNDPTGAAAAATARASGARVLALGNTDPRTSSESIKAIAGQPIEHVLAVGGAFGPADRLRRRLATAATGVELPGGGQVLFPGRRMVALYGHPGDTGLGALGEQPVDAAIARAQAGGRELQRAGGRAGRTHLRDHHDGGVQRRRLRRQLLQ